MELLELRIWDIEGMAKARRKPEDVAIENYLDRLRGITGALQCLVEVLAPAEFLVMFKKLHDDNNAQYEQEKTKR
jgi:hypothetical protein